MDYSQIPFDGSYMGFPSDTSTFTNSQILFADFGPTDVHGHDNSNSNSNSNSNNNMINDLCFINETGSVAASHYEYASLQRFLKDQQHPAPFQFTSTALPVAPFPSVTSHHHPSSCSSGRSPRADTDAFTEENMPSTPPDFTLLASPFQTPPPCEAYQPKSTTFLSDMGALVADSHSCVSMADINPAGCHGRSDWNETTPDAVLDFQSPQDTALAVDEPSDGELDFGPSNMDEEEEDDGDEYQPTTKIQALSSVRRSSGRNKRAAPRKTLDKTPLKKSKPSASSTMMLPQGMMPIPPSPQGTKHASSCRECNHLCKDEATLQTHIRKHHVRPFPCVFGWAGCTATFPNKNEWKRHVMSQDIARHFWVCEIDACARTKHVSSSSSCSSSKKQQQQRHNTTTTTSTSSGAIFNRKDLFTQHIRRMHPPPPPASSDDDDEQEDYETETIKRLQAAALRERCQLPTYMTCPARGCAQQFAGAEAWDLRMEHVARHLERAAAGDEEPVMFGGEGDASLVEWATRADVGVVSLSSKNGGGWVLNNPLRAAGRSGVGRRRRRRLRDVVVKKEEIAADDDDDVVVVKDEEECHMWDLDAEGEEE